MRANPVSSGLVLLLGAACASPDGGSPSVRPPSAPGDPTLAAEQRLAPPPWTDAFERPAVLVAEEVRVEGPVGLLHHLATVSDPEEFERTEKTVPEGFLQEVAVKPDTPGAEIRAQLDGLAIVAFRRLTALERPGEVDVVVVARGEAYWAGGEKGSEVEKRGDILRFQGKIVR